MGVLRIRAKRACHLDPVEPGHADVEDDRVESRGGRGFDRLHTVERLMHLPAGAGQALTDDEMNHRVIVRDEQMERRHCTGGSIRVRPCWIAKRTSVATS